MVKANNNEKSKEALDISKKESQDHPKKTSKSLVEELKERIDSDKILLEEYPEKKIVKEELSDKYIEEISDKITDKDIEEEKKNVDGKKETLIPLEDYIKCAVHLGTKVITPNMRKYVYKRRADGLAVINTALIDDKLREAISFLINYNPEQIYIACKREAGWSAAKKFEEVTGIKSYTKKYPPGITVNLELEDFFEAELTIICAPWIDKNALNDTAKLKKPVISLCDTNNFTTNITKIIPCNNKSKKSVGCILFILAREYCKAKKMPFNSTLVDFAGEIE
jgi:small subunit ribosomal protein S2